MLVRIEKYRLPIIWLDTFIIIGMTKLNCGETLSSIEQERYKRLYQELLEKVSQEKIICPEADQNEEIEHGQRLEKECNKTQAKLSLGVRFRHRLEIEANQMFKVMDACIKGKEEAIISVGDAFYKDPLEVVRRTISSGLITTAFMPPQLGQIEMEIKTKSRTKAMLENLRRDRISKGINYETQLEEEYQGKFQAGNYSICKCLSKIKAGINLSYEDYSQLEIIAQPYAEWERLNGQPAGLDGLFAFLNSDEYKLIPYVDIYARLTAKIITGNTEILSGDVMDINQLSAVIPYCNYVVTDRKMKNRLIELGIDKKYQTKIFYIGDLEEIIEILDSL